MESEQLSHFERLAQRVETLLGKYQELKEAKEQLELLLMEKEEEIEALRKKGAAREQETAQAREKVDGVISRIDRFLETAIEK